MGSKRTVIVLLRADHHGPTLRRIIAKIERFRKLLGLGRLEDT